MNEDDLVDVVHFKSNENCKFKQLIDIAELIIQKMKKI